MRVVLNYIKARGAAIKIDADVDADLIIVRINSALSFNAEVVDKFLATLRATEF